MLLLHQISQIKFENIFFLNFAAASVPLNQNILTNYNFQTVKLSKSAIFGKFLRNKYVKFLKEFSTFLKIGRKGKNFENVLGNFRSS